MQLVSGLLSNNAAKVRIVLAEKGIEYETLEVPWTKEHAWQPKPQYLLDANPRAQVPVLLDGDFALWDSTVINEYLEEQFPQCPLLPADPHTRALCRLWEDEGDFNQVHVGVLIQDVFLAHEDAPFSAAAVSAQEQLEGFFARVERQLIDPSGDAAYLCGRYSVADISVFLTVAFAQTLGVALQGPRIERWYATMLERDVVRAEWQAIVEGVARL